MADHHPAVTGHVRVDTRARDRVWIAEYVKADGHRTRRTLGTAWVKNSGRKTSRGAVIWRAADGSKPDPTYLTPRDAQAKLDELLEAERAKPRTTHPTTVKTFLDACDSWLHHVEHFKGVEDTTLRNYRVIVGMLKQDFPASLPLSRIVADRIERYQIDLLTTPVKRRRGSKPAAPLSRKTVRGRMLVLRAVLERARVRGWLVVNPAADVPIVPDPGPDPDFNVLEPSKVEAVAAAIEQVDHAELPRMRNGEIDQHCLTIMGECRMIRAEAVRLAAYTGLRFGELRDLRWRDIDWAGRNLKIQRNTPSSAPAGAKSKKPKGKRARSVPLIDQAVAVLHRIKAAGYPCGPNDLILPNSARGKLESGKTRDAFYRGLNAIGLGYLREKENPITLHDLRHTFGSIAVRKMPLSDVQVYLGHAQITTTMRYIHYIPRNDAARLLSEAFAADLGPERPRDAALPMAA